MLIVNAKKQSCGLNLKESHKKNLVLIGDFIFDAFAIEFGIEDNIVKLYRLDNNWGKYYNIERKHTQGAEYGYFWGFMYYFFIVLWSLIKVLLALAVLSILINCYFRK